MKMNWYDLSKYRNQLYGLSMLWIVVFHVWESFKGLMSTELVISYIIRCGNYGVDIFLFLSGISMFFAIKKYIDNEGNIRIYEFYKKRVSKILKVYVSFCIPYFVLIHLILKRDVSLFLQQVFFYKDRVSSFWFLLAIVICYLLYPFIYKLMVRKQKKIVIALLLVYIAGLFFGCICCSDLYEKYEILLSRIPIFVLGALCGTYVYDKKEMSPYGILTAIILLLSRKPVFGIIEYVPVLNMFSIVLKRLYGGLIGICAIIFLIIVVKYIEETKLFKLIGKLGTFTLETYVFHIAYRAILLKIPFIKVDSLADVSLFLILYTISSFAFAWLLSLILNRKMCVFRPERSK